MIKNTHYGILFLMIFGQNISLGQVSVDSVKFPLESVEMEEQSKGEVAAKIVQEIHDTQHRQSVSALLQYINGEVLVLLLVSFPALTSRIL